jgi:Heterokaryon incompatibility protein (HET)
VGEYVSAVMRLLKRLLTGDLELISFDDDDPPPYAILSHTWGDESQEVTFEEMDKGIGGHKAGFEKIKFCGEQAARDGLRYFWLDSCCTIQTLKPRQCT